MANHEMFLAIRKLAYIFWTLKLATFIEYQLGITKFSSEDDNLIVEPLVFPLQIRVNIH